MSPNAIANKVVGTIGLPYTTVDRENFVTANTSLKRL
jgi:hypothetical protein